MPLPNEKRDLETGAILQFTGAWTLLHGQQRLVFHKLCNPPEPDCLCTLDGQPLHVEIGHIYGTESDVKQILGRTGRSAPSSPQKLLSTMVPLDTRLPTPLNKLLADKAIKTYRTSRVWLLVRSASPLWSIDDFKAHLAAIAIPPEHPFEQIWLLCGPRASFGLLPLA